METLIPQATFDCVDRFLYPSAAATTTTTTTASATTQVICHHHSVEEETALPVLGSNALEQLLSQSVSDRLVPNPALEAMERMSPDSSVDWKGSNNSSSMTVASSLASPSGSSVSSSASLVHQPDSTTADLNNYDSDAFNSDDSNHSFAELELNPNLISNLVAQATQQQQQQQQHEQLNFQNNNFNQQQLSPSSGHSLSSFEEDDSRLGKAKKQVRRKKQKRAGDVLIKCELCPYSTRYKEHLTSHMNTHNEDRNYLCDDCGQTFKWSHSLKRHQRTHQTDFKQYSCQFCFKAFSRKDHLTIHENLHKNSNETFPCNVCGATFKNKKTLSGHMKTHSNEKQFKCGQCDSEFTRRASLNRHVRAAHSGQVIPCPFCPAHFSYRSTLEDHKKAVHNEGRREYECQLCGVQFAVKAYLTKHLVRYPLYCGPNYIWK